MRILKLTSTEIKPAIAKVHKNKDTNTLFFNIKHGMYGIDTWAYSCCLYKETFIPKHVDDNYILNENTYILKAVIKDGNVLKDKQNNVIYNILNSKHNSNNKHNLILWEIPNNNYSNIDYSIHGTYSILGSGISNFGVDDIPLLAPAPVIETVGDVKLIWTATDIDDNKISQTIIYNSITDIWTIGNILKD